MTARVQIVSPDPAFARSIGARVHGWGLSVAIAPDLADLAPPAGPDPEPDVVLLDLRDPADGSLGRLAAVKRARPALEVILLSQPGRVAASIDAMRAGASDELSAPFDLAALRRSLSAALRRRRRRLGGRRGSLLARLERAFTAAALAEEGEHEAARELLAEGAPPARRRRGDGTRE